MRAEIAKLHQRVGATMIYVTHDQVETMTLGDHIAVVRARASLQCGGSFTLALRRPRTRPVAGSPAARRSTSSARTSRADGGWIVANGVTIALARGAQRAAVARFQERGLVNVGIRPRTCIRGRHGRRDPGDATEVREPLETNETLVHWKSPLGEIVSRAPGQSSLAVGRRPHCRRRSKLHLFDPATELSLTAAPSRSEGHGRMTLLKAPSPEGGGLLCCAEKRAASGPGTPVRRAAAAGRL